MDTPVTDQRASIGSGQKPAASVLTRPPVIVAIGDSLVAGMQDDNLDQRRQEQAFVNQFAKNAGVPFNMPTLGGLGTPLRVFENNVMSLKRTVKDYVRLVSTTGLASACRSLFGAPPAIVRAIVHAIAGRPGARLLRSKDTPEHPQQDFGVPGFKIQDVIDRQSDLDYLAGVAQHTTPPGDAAIVAPLVHSILQNDTSQLRGSQLDQAVRQQPDLVVLWAGANDAMPATATGVLDDSTLTPLDDRRWKYFDRQGQQHETEDVKPGLITSVKTIVDRLEKETSAEIVIFNVPDVTELPSLKALGEKIGPLPFRVKVGGADVTDRVENFTLPLTVKGPGKDGRTEFPRGTKVDIGKLLANPNILFPTYGTVAKWVTGTDALFTENDVVDPDKKQVVQTRIQDFNHYLEQLAAVDPRVHVVDVPNFIRMSRQGYLLRGEGKNIIVSDTYAGTRDAQGRPGYFSNDGSHPSDVGQAALANKLLRVVQSEMGDDPRFAMFKDVEPIDERAALLQDPHYLFGESQSPGQTAA